MKKDKKESKEYTELEKLSEELIKKTNESEKLLRNEYVKMNKENITEDGKAKIDGTISSLWRAGKNIRKAQIKLFSLTDEFSARWEDIKQSRKKRRFIPAAPANSLVDEKERELKHFTEGMNIYKLLWVCYIGSLFGVLIEMFWCLLMEGVIKSRAGLVIGPFNLLYGVGAVAVTAATYKYRNKGKWLSFIGGFVFGSLTEYLCSYFQELFFGTVSWDYSSMPININGRICLAYSVIWGILGVLWIKSIYPRLSYLMLKMPSKVGKVITWVLLAFFVINAILSALAVFRWSQRVDGIESSNLIFDIVDKIFTDERMSIIYSNMKF